jgi:hypothetical protein
MTSFLNSSIIDFSNPIVSVKSTGMKLGLGFPLSVRNMLKHRDTSRTRFYGICVCEYSGQSRGTKINAEWLNRCFSDPMGIASYFKKMSGGRQFIEWQMFVPNIPIMTYSQKVDLAKQVKEKGTWVEFDGTRQAALKIGIPLESFHTWIWIIDDNNISEAGVTANSPNTDSNIAAKDINPNLLCHEMTHGLGLYKHASSYEGGGYGDSFCLMGDGLKFVNSRLTVPDNEWFVSIPGNSRPRGNSGPGICTPYLYGLGWLDRVTNVNSIHFFTTVGGYIPSGSLSGDLFANQGAPPVGSSRQIAIVITFGPLSSFGDYWIEYRVPQGFDSGFISKSPPEGILLVREVFAGQSFIIDQIPVKMDAILRLPKIDYLVDYLIRITDVDLPNQKISYTLAWD